MIALLGGEYDGKYLDRDVLPIGDGIGIVDDDGIREIYRMQPGGYAVSLDDPYAAMHCAVRPGDLT